MSMYQPLIPTGTVNLDVDYLSIRDNFTQLDTSFGVDHVTFSNQTSQNGYHESIHFNPVSTTATNPPNNQPVVTPTATAGFGQLFSSEINDGINTDTALYFLTGGNRLSQLTRNFQPVASTVGYTYLPGGLILQYGKNVSTGKFTVVNFTTVGGISFPNNIFSVVATRGQEDTGTTYGVTDLSVTGFTFTSDSSSVGNRFYWIAIGN